MQIGVVGCRLYHTVTLHDIYTGWLDVYLATGSAVRRLYFLFADGLVIVIVNGGR